MGIYEELGVRPLINAAGTVTNYGGSVMDPEIFEVMSAANREFCRLEDLHPAVGRRIAGLLDVEAAYVTSSAAAGLLVTAAACIAGTDPERITQLPDTTGMKSEVVVQQIHRLAYDQALRLAGATFVEVPDGGAPPTDALRAAVGPDTAAILCMAHRLGDPASVPLADLVSIAQGAGVPLIVDAASECPPLSTLTRFWKAGADLTIFSGGKSIMGPQSTGLVVGRQDLIDACMANGNPFATGTAAFALTRRELLGRKFVILFFFLSIFFEVGLIPYYMVLRAFGLLNTFWVYIIPAGFSVWTMIVMKTSFQGLPDGLTEAARMDGAGYPTIFFRIVVPLSIPMFAVLGLFSAVTHWNDYFTGEFFVNTEPRLWPLQTFLRVSRQNAIDILKGVILDYSNMSPLEEEASRLTQRSLDMAFTVFAMVPILLVYPWLQRYFVKGVLIGSIKE